MVRSRPDLGLTDVGLSAGDHQHRLMGLRMELGGMDPIILAAAYLEVGVGLNAVNRSILSTIAQWQEAASLPVLVGGDFNVPPRS